MNKPQSLRELVDLAIAKHQTSVRQLGFKAQEHGFKMHGTTLNHLRNGTYKSVPSGDTIRAIAWLAGVSDEVAFMAAGQPVPGPPFAEELPPGVDNLPAKARKAAIDMLRVLVDMNKEVVGNGGDHPTHMNQAGESPASPKAKKVPYVDPHAHPDADSAGNVPLPSNWYELAADSSRNYGAEEVARASARGEETQDNEEGDLR
ncbi:hypothetical protein MB46_10265 [Arthrobacter alpinus]|uniref:hypothetical protein n=1 Tax=Arthrobacter alpinus TaxID=656366 RepID=UPI000678E421|nr:hypothetical protein [Arthrobacter alpinus]ALV45805.1 hypothetical protein MB46_10265 [Arthrobacter alpinus]